MRHLIAAVCVALLAVACSSSDDSSGTTEVGAVPETGLPENIERCEEVPAPVVEFLEAGLLVENGSLDFPNAVQSNDFGGLVYMVAAEIHNDFDWEQPGDVAVWGVRYLNIAGEGVAGIVPVQGYYQDMSEYPNTPSDIIVTEFADGVRSAWACSLDQQGLIVGG